MPDLLSHDVSVSVAAASPLDGGVGRRPVSALLLLAEHSKLLRRIGSRIVTRDEVIDLVGPGCEKARRSRLRELEALTILRRASGGSRRSCAWVLGTAGGELALVNRLAVSAITAVPLIAELPPRWQAQGFRDVLKRLADGPTLKIACAVAGAPKRPAELGQQLGLGRDAVYGRLNALADTRVVERRSLNVFPRETNYELLESWRCLASVVVLCARWEFRWARPADPALASNLAGLIDVIATAAQAPADAWGTYQLGVLDPATLRGRFLMEIDAEGVRTAPLGHTPHVTIAGTPLSWCESLVAARPRGLTLVPGSRQDHGACEAAARQVLAVLNQALFADLRGRQAGRRRPQSGHTDRGVA